MLRGLSLLFALAVVAPANAQNACWSAERRVAGFVRDEVERLHTLHTLETTLQDLRQLPSDASDLPVIAGSVVAKIIEQRELARELIAGLERLRHELRQCSRN